ncbi:MAG: (2Fe-2S) ferredoxin domain-containing protein [Alphaproteobacteria bacterium]|nr:(2Fe-2S) ferredoxin domain-containing protein [Alphaproteobacteria bacterium]MBF0128778.1 (2Fe-2S) ferredoxin domain-containing protein [Alphaproteobacteria bacterium]
MDTLFYRIHVFCCTYVRTEPPQKASCGMKDSGSLRAYMKSRAKELGLSGVRINTSGCLNRCEHGPVMVIYPEGVWYGYRSRDDVDEILQTHLVEGKRVERLLLTNDQR